MSPRLLLLETLVGGAVGGGAMTGWGRSRMRRRPGYPMSECGLLDQLDLLLCFCSVEGRQLEPAIHAHHFTSLHMTTIHTNAHYYKSMHITTKKNCTPLHIITHNSASMYITRWCRSDSFLGLHETIPNLIYEAAEEVSGD